MLFCPHLLHFPINHKRTTLFNGDSFGSLIARCISPAESLFPVVCCPLQTPLSLGPSRCEQLGVTARLDDSNRRSVPCPLLRYRTFSPFLAFLSSFTPHTFFLSRQSLHTLFVSFSSFPSPITHSIIPKDEQRLRTDNPPPLLDNSNQSWPPLLTTTTSTSAVRRILVTAPWI